jgi:CheY-like chemotaxis protein
MTSDKIPAEKPSVLLVDDEMGVLWTIGRFLTRNGFSVTTCPDGVEAIKELQTRRFNVVVTDIRMPRLSGLGLLDWVREHQPQTRVVVMSGFGSAGMKEFATSKGAILYLEKPVDLTVLVEMLRCCESNCSFWGTVNDIDILDYVQLMLLTGRKALLEVRSREGHEGLLFIDRGAIVHAVCGDLIGEAALYQCLTFPAGCFQGLPWREPDSITIGKPSEFLLIEAARMRDERREPAESQSALP